MIYRFIALSLALLSFLLSAHFSRTVFERLPHLEDEVAYLFQAKMLARGDLTIESPQPSRAYWQPFVVDFDGVRSGKYPPGWPALLALGVRMGQAWVINAFFAALNVALAYRLGRELVNRDAGLIAALLLTFSPMALLLNATLMGHSAALFATTLLLYAYWRMQQGGSIGWGLLAGVGLGMVAFNRPLTGVGVAAPLVMWSIIRLARTFIREREQFGARLRPLVALSAATLLFAATIPLHNWAMTGDPTHNLYTLVWDYDRVGFGDSFGREGHTLAKGLRHARFDLSLTAADLFGWQLGGLTAELQEHLRSEADTWPVFGVSWILLPFGLIVGARKRWTWLLLSLPAALIIIHLAYWIGAQRYSTRYYFEALTAVTILSALPLAWLARRTRRWLVYGPLMALIAVSFFTYSGPRIAALRGFNQVSQAQISAVEARREGDRPLLVIVSGQLVRWRAYGSLMAVTSPYLDSDIVAARDNLSPGRREAIIARFSGRQIVEMAANENQIWFVDEGASGATN